MKKLYKVEVTFETVVYADNKDVAEATAEEAIQNGNEEPTSTIAKEINCTTELPEGWNGDCIPWTYSANEPDETIYSILEPKS